MQATFLLLNLFVGIRFYLWVRALEQYADTAIARPAGVEGWLPIAGLMNLKFLVLTGTVPDVHPAGMFLLLAFLTMSFLFRKAFCSWLCPIGTLSEWLWQGGRELFGRTWRLPAYIDLPLRALKYLLLGAFVYLIGSMSADDISGFLASPYGVVADVKMLDFFRHAGETTIGVVSALVILSVLSKNVWCRYLCPYGALMGLVALVSPLRIVRNPVSCIDCGKCAKACSSFIPVDRLRQVHTAECTACLQCVSACPVNEALELRPRALPHRVTAGWLAAGIAVVFCLMVGYARVTGTWEGRVPDVLLRQLVPMASAIRH
jgi:polyferredoxin